MHVYSIQLGKMEKTNTVIRGPKWKPTFATKIAPGRNVSLIETERESTGVHVFTDGSAIEKGVGASAVLYINGTEKKVARKYLGTTNEHTVFEAELMGVIMGIKMLMHKNAHRYRISIDNQAAISTSQVEKGISRQYLVQALHKQAEELRVAQSKSQLVIGWVPGHKGIRGNERADVEASRSTQGGEQERGHPSQAKKNAHNQQGSGEPQARAKRDFTQSLRAHNALHINPTVPLAAYYKMSREKPRHHMSLLVQLRTGHAMLHKHLYRMHKVNSPICPAVKDRSS